MLWAFPSNFLPFNSFNGTINLTRCGRSGVIMSYSNLCNYTQHIAIYYSMWLLITTSRQELTCQK